MKKLVFESLEEFNFSNASNNIEKFLEEAAIPLQNQEGWMVSSTTLNASDLEYESTAEALKGYYEILDNPEILNDYVDHTHIRGFDIDTEDITIYWGPIDEEEFNDANEDGEYDSYEDYLVGFKK